MGCLTLPDFETPNSDSDQHSALPAQADIQTDGVERAARKKPFLYG